MAIVLSHLLVTRPVDLVAMRQHVARMLQHPELEWEEHAIKMHQEWRATTPEGMHIDILFSPDRVMLDPVLADPSAFPDTHAWFPRDVSPIFASVTFEMGGPWGETPEERLIESLYPPLNNPRALAARRLHMLLLAKLADWLREAGCEVIPWYVSPFDEHPDEWDKAWRPVEELYEEVQTS